MYFNTPAPKMERFPAFPPASTFSAHEQLQDLGFIFLLFRQNYGQGVFIHWYENAFFI